MMDDDHADVLSLSLVGLGRNLGRQVYSPESGTENITFLSQQPG
jgi:hypothetical protein